MASHNKELVHCFIDKVDMTGLAIVSLTFSCNTGTSAMLNMYAQAQGCTAKCCLSIFFLQDLGIY